MPMPRFVPSAVLALSVALFVTACDISLAALDAVEGNGVERTEERPLPDFQEVSFTGSGRLEVTAGDNQSVSITCDDNLLSLIETEVENDRLVIGQSEPIAPEVDLVVRITMPAVRAVTCSGAGSMEVRGLDEDDFVVGLSGAGKVGLAGRSDRLEINVSGVGSVDAEDLVTREAIVRVSGVGKAHVNASERVDARVSGVGRVTYLGKPIVEKSVSGLGMISPRD